MEGTDVTIHGRRRHMSWCLASVIGLVSVAVGLTNCSSDRADSGQPQPSSESEVTAAVEQRALTASVVLSATYEIEGAAEIRSAAGEDEGGRQIVTKVPPPPGTTVTAGTAVAAVNYRPVLLMRGALPLYRDIRPGMTGDDVATFQSGLRAMGFEIPDDQLGTFGPAGQDAVRAIFTEAGYEPDYTNGSAAATDAAVRAAADQAEAAYQAANAAHQRGEDVAELREAYRLAKANADEVARASGVMVRAASVVTVDAPSLIVGSVNARLGEAVSPGTLLATLAADTVSLNAQLTSTQAEIVVKAERAEVAGEGGQCRFGTPEPAPGPDAAADPSTDAGSPALNAGNEPQEESTAGDRPGGGTVDGPLAAGQFTVTITCDPAPSIEKVGSETTVSAVSQLAGAESLVVPASALVYGPDGSASVFVVAPGRSRAKVGVSVVAEADGFVAITAEDPALRSEARVVVSE